MPVAPGAQNLGVDSAAVVAHENPQVARRILKLHFNGAGVRVAECIRERFMANKINLITDRPNA